MFFASLRFIASQGGRRSRTLLATSGERLALEHVLWTGDVDAPEMEIEMLAVLEVDAEGRLVASITFDPDDRRAASAEMLDRYSRSDEARWTPAAFFELSRALYEHEDLDVARARFEALRPDRAQERPDPQRIPPNAATRGHDRVLEYMEAGDWDALRALAAPVVMDDRRRLIRLDGDAEMFLSHCRELHRSRARLLRTLLATAGDRLALEHQLWTEGEGRAPFEIELLTITEVDDAGRLVANIAFDPDDRRAASLEMYERYARSDAGRWTSPQVERHRAQLDHDLERLRALLPADHVYHDRRRTGAGRLEGPDAHVAWLAALFEQSPDAIIEPLYYVATGPQGALSVGHTFG